MKKTGLITSMAIFTALVFCAVIGAQDNAPEPERERDHGRGPQVMLQRMAQMRMPMRGVIENPSPQLKEALDERISLALEEVPLMDALEKVRQETELNIVLGPELHKDPKGNPVWLTVKDVSVGNVLRIMAAACELELVIDGDIVLFKMPPERKIAEDRANGDIKVAYTAGGMTIEISGRKNMLPEWMLDQMIDGLAAKLKLQPPPEEEKK
ncbi:MAG TPA: hypothetical protein PL033_00985 [Candidatus Brocadiia bacterium]|nr:hypothetical protein [Candidatus Brocadiia bacterium]